MNRIYGMSEGADGPSRRRTTDVTYVLNQKCYRCPDCALRPQMADGKGTKGKKATVSPTS
jgi:hypothetical protein